MNGHDLAREIIGKHGRDRYPTPELAALKLCAEVGELASELLRNRDYGDPENRGPEAAAWAAKVRKELGDVGLTLYALANQLEISLEPAMEDVVNGETRTFSCVSR